MTKTRSIKGTHVVIDGAGPPLVLLHGVGLDHTMWDSHVAAFSDCFQVIRYDFWGHGQSIDPPGPRSLDDLVAQFIMVIDALGLAKVSLVGFSLGGLTARAVVAKHRDRLERAVFMNTIAARDPGQLSGVRERLEQAEREGPAAIIDAAIERWFSADFLAGKPAIIDQVRRRLESNDPAAFLKCYRIYGLSDGQVPVPAAARDMPVLVMTAENDLNSTPAMAEDMAAAFVRGEVHVVPKLRHMAPVEAPALVNSVLLDFLWRDKDHIRRGETT